MYIWQEIELQTPFITIRGKKTGNGSRKILGIHGLLDNANTFDHLIPLLKPEYTLVSIDLPGHGKSDHYRDALYSLQNYIVTIKMVIKELCWSQFTLMGHSLGSMLALIYNAAYPAEVDSLILLEFGIPEPYCFNYYPKFIQYFTDKYLECTEYLELPPIVYDKETLLNMMIEATDYSLDKSAAECLFERSVHPNEDGKKYCLTRDLRAKRVALGYFAVDAWIALANSITSPIFWLQVSYH